MTTVLTNLEEWLVQQDWRGWDPFDALNSPLLKSLTLGMHFPGIAWLQLLKRLPLNLRPLLSVTKRHNAKAIGLFLSAHALRYQRTHEASDLARINYFYDWLFNNANREFGGAGWGYPFDWPNRTFYCPAGTPTVVNTAFIGFALLEAYHATADERQLALATAAAEFINAGLNSSRDEAGECSSYTPLDNARVHNANLLGGALLWEVGSLSQNSGFLATAAARYNWSLAHQAADGSWPYGVSTSQGWIDSFHTGYNLDALDRAVRLTPDPVFESALERGYRFYLDNFFEEDGTVKYYHEDRWPLDAHAFAHAIITLTRLQRLDSRSLPLRRLVLGQLQQRFWSNRGYFYYQQQRHHTNRIAYTRWVQAWAFLALVTCCEET
ncbi:MAG: hypothetical protein ISR91_02070 [Candidatus Delongbacteria bacterium]|nr:hypothetical protein [Candidatus Delongbacteria bacterium]